MRTRKFLVSLLLVALVSGGAVSALAQQGGPWGEPGEGAVATALAAAAAETGLSTADILTQISEGATLAEIVTIQGGDVQVVIDAALASMTERVNDAVEDGLLVQARADAILANLDAMITDAVNGEWSRGNPLWDGAGRGFGRGPGGRNQGGRGAGPGNGFGGRGQGGPGFGPGMGGFGFLSGRGWSLGGDVLAELGLDTTIVSDELRAGSTVAEAIISAGGDPEAALEAALAAAEERMAQAVANGRLTQEAADQHLALLGARLAEWLQTSPLENRLALQIVPGALQLAADELGMTPREVRAALADGLTLGQLLSDNGIDQTAFVDALVQRAAARLNVQVVDGHLTQAQADEALAGIRALIEARLSGGLEDTAVIGA